MEAWKRIESSKAAKVLLDYLELKLLEPFFQEPCSVSNAAKVLSMDIKQLHYHVQHFVDLGLLKITSTEKRPGRPIKLYQTVAQGFFVPFTLANVENLEDFSIAFTKPVQQELAHGIVKALIDTIPDLVSWGINVTRDPKLGMQYFPAPKPGDATLFTIMVSDENFPAASDRWHYLELNHKDAKEFEKEMQALVEYYKGKGGNQRYLVHTAIAPVKN